MRPRARELGISFTAGLWLVGAIVVLSLVVAASVRRIAPDEIGIRIVNIGSDKGLVKKDFDAGFYRNIWLVETWDSLPRSVQRVTFTNRNDLRGPDDQPAIEAKTKEGDRITVEATVLFRIPDGKGHVVYQDCGRGDAFKRIARDIAGAEIPIAFATLGTEKIYDSEARRGVYEALTKTLGSRLSELRNLELVDIAITEVTYDPNYESRLQRKKVADQKTLLNKSLEIKARVEGEKKTIIQDTDNKVKQIQNDAKNEVTRMDATNLREIERVKAEATEEEGRIKAEGLEYKALREGEGTQAVKEAEAYAVQKSREAMGENGQNIVGYLAAQNFPVKQVIMPSVGIDWFNPMSLTRSLLGTVDNSQ
jgi:regulator of protease activity HflC (stomatin/prohibitin superfamily)